MTTIDLDRFQPVALADMAVLRPFLDRHEVRLCDYSYTNLYCWGNVYDTRWLLQDGRLWIHIGRFGLLQMPVGESIPAAGLRAVSDELSARGLPGRIILAEQRFVAETAGLEQYFQVREDPDNADYIYQASRLVELKGKRLAKKKNLIAQFLKNEPGYRCLPLSGADGPQCLELTDRWCLVKNCDSTDFKEECRALERAMAAFDTLELGGLKIMVRDQMVAFCVFSALNRATADIHFEKADPAVKGAAQVINWETARLLAPRFLWLNREQDLGLEGLRQAKRSYDPDHLEMTYHLDPLASSTPPRL